MKGSLVFGVDFAHFPINDAGLDLLFPFGRFKSLHHIGHLEFLGRHTCQFNDPLHGIPFTIIDERDGFSQVVCPTRSTDAVDIIVWIAGDRKVDDAIRFGDIDAARGNVCGNEHADIALPEGVHGVQPAVLRFVAVNRTNAEVENAIEVLGDAFGVFLSADEDHPAAIRNFFGAEEMFEEGEFGSEIGQIHLILRHIPRRRCLRRHFDAGRPKQEFIGQPLDPFGKSGREEEILALRRQEFLDVPELGHEPHVHHAIRFIDNHMLDFPRKNAPATVQVQESTRCGDQQVDSTGDFSELLLGTDASVEPDDSQVGVVREFLGLTGDLDDELFCGSQHQPPRNFSLRILQHRQEGQEKRGCFSGAGGCDAHNVLSCPNGWNRLGLNVRRSLETSVFSGLDELFCELELGKGHGTKVLGLSCAPMCEDRFRDMRPFLDAEVQAAVQRLTGESDLREAMDVFLGSELAGMVWSHCNEIESIEDFQSLVSKPLIKHLLKLSASEVTFNFPDDFDPVGALFISNHRDIVLDPALINLALADRGAPTTEIGIGSNLLGLSWVRDIVRLNRSFIVPRGGGPRDQLKASSDVAAYVRSVVMDQQRSVWLAQREGRAKDGNDLTSPALIRMLLDRGGRETWEGLRVHAVALSYEWDPCDAMKVRELLIRKSNNGEYKKAVGEDERSMRRGLLEWKGRIRISFSAPLAWVEGEERDAVRLASAVDDQIHSQLHPFENAEYAAYLCGYQGVHLEVVEDQKVRAACEKRLTAVIEEVQADTDFTAEEIRAEWCSMMARPWVNARLAAGPTAAVSG